MKIAVTYKDGKVFEHFGKTESFKIYNVEDGKIVSSEVVGTGGNSHGALAGFIKGLGADVLICGGLGEGAKNAVQKQGIKLYAGAEGGADEAVLALLDGSLVASDSANCNHHEHEHHHEHNHEHNHECSCGK